jgi:two-component system chemotaxis response regulator CheB
MSRKIRVLIADDSSTLRAALMVLLEQDAHLEVVGQARDGMEAVHLAHDLKPDVIAMDVNMPRLDGLRATEAIMADAPSRVLVISAVGEDSEIDLSLRAIEAGALELIAKPRGGPGELRSWGKHVAASIRLMAEVPVVRRYRRSMARQPMLGHPGGIQMVGLVASTGGPPALASVLKELPAGLEAPILIAQHIAEGFTKGLVRWFGSVSKLKVEVARRGISAQPGFVYLAPDGCDLILDEHRLLQTPKSSGLHSPSGDLLLSSLAQVGKARAAGFVLTGMGDDGAAGLSALCDAGGATFAQDEPSSVVFGMPQAAYACGAARALLPLESIAPAIVELCRKAWR